MKELNLKKKKLLKEKIRIMKEAWKDKNLSEVDIDIDTKDYKILKKIAKKLDCTVEDIVTVFLTQIVKEDFASKQEYPCIDIAEMLLLLEKKKKIKKPYIVYNDFDIDKPFMLLPPEALENKSI